MDSCRLESTLAVSALSHDCGSRLSRAPKSTAAALDMLTVTQDVSDPGGSDQGVIRVMCHRISLSHRGHCCSLRARLWSRMYDHAVCGYGIYFAPSLAPHARRPVHRALTDGIPARGAVAHDPRPRPVRSSPYKAERQSALAPPARFPCDQGRDRRGGAGTWRMAPPRVRQANAHHKPHQTTETVSRCLWEY